MYRYIIKSHMYIYIETKRIRKLTASDKLIAFFGKVIIN